MTGLPSRQEAESAAPAPGLWRCSAAGHQGDRWLPRSEFWRKTASPTGLQNHCRECTKKDALARYYANPQAARERVKRFVLRTGYVHSPETQERNRQRKRQERLEVRLERARLLVGLVAQEYGLPPCALHGPCHSGSCSPVNQAQAIAVRLVRRFTFLPEEEIAAVLGCTPRAVRRRLKRARQWTRGERGDIRVVERVRRITAAYRQQVPSRSQERLRGVNRTRAG